MPATYNYLLVELSLVTAICAAYVALDLAGRTAAAFGRMRFVWLVGAAASIGLGIWSTHSAHMGWNIGVVVVAVLIAATLASLADRRLSAQALALQASEKRYRRFFERSHSGVYQSSTDAAPGASHAAADAEPQATTNDEPPAVANVEPQAVTKAGPQTATHTGSPSPAPTVSLSSQPVLDIDEVLARVEGDRDLLRELAAMFREEAPRLLAEIRRCAEARDAHGLDKSAHSLKGACANLSAKSTANAAYALETLGRSSSFDGVMVRVDELEIESTRLDQALLELSDEETL